MEQQSEYQTIDADKSFTWQVKWYLRELPGDAKAEPGNTALLEFVESIAN